MAPDSSNLGPANDEPTERPADAQVELSIAATKETVWAHLSDPRTYPEWLVGAKDIREVDPQWPDTGSRFHHRVGFGPLTIDDATAVVRSSAPSELVLRASVGPIGSALVRFRLAGSDPTTVYFDEAPDSGLLRFVGTTLGRLVLRASVWGRNELSMQHLKDLIEQSSTAPTSEPEQHLGEEHE